MHRALRPSGDVHDLEALHRIGAPLDAVDERGRTVLYVAAAAGFEEAVQWLLEKGANSCITADDGRTALHAAAASGHAGTCKLLLGAYGAENLHGATRALQSQDMHGRTAADVAAAARQMDVVRVLLSEFRRCSRAINAAPTREAASKASPTPEGTWGLRPHVEVLGPTSPAAKEMMKQRGWVMPEERLYSPQKSVANGSVFNRVARVRPEV